MSRPVTKGSKKSTATAKRTSAKKSAVKSTTAKAARPKATKAAAPRSKTKKTASAKTSKAAAKTTKRAVAKSKPAAKKAKPAKKAVAKKPVAKKVEKATKKIAAPRVKKTQKLAAVRAPRPVPSPPRQPTLDESAALRAFERAHKEFTHGRFGEARNQFRVLLDKYSQVSEVAARARTYLTIAESRLRTESMLPRDADSLYDRGVIELNRGEYVAAQEMFERALKREPEAAHIHYGLAATRARLGSVDLALQSLQRALDLQPNLRVRAQHDQDLTALRNDPDFDKLVFQPRF